MKMEHIVYNGDDAAAVTSSCEHVRVSIEGSPEVWFRRRISEDEDGNVTCRALDMEIITSNQEVEDCLKELAEANPEAVRILTTNEDGGFHAVVGPEICVILMPLEGTMKFLLGEKTENEDGSSLEIRIDSEI